MSGQNICGSTLTGVWLDEAEELHEETAKKQEKFRDWWDAPWTDEEKEQLTLAEQIDERMAREWVRTGDRVMAEPKHRLFSYHLWKDHQITRYF